MTSRVLVALRIAAPPGRVFEAFTAEIGQWWRPNALFPSSNRQPGRLAMQPGVGGRVTETLDDGQVVEIGRILVWEPPRPACVHVAANLVRTRPGDRGPGWLRVGHRGKPSRG